MAVVTNRTSGINGVTRGGLGRTMDTNKLASRPEVTKLKNLITENAAKAINEHYGIDPSKYGGYGSGGSSGGGGGGDTSNYYNDLWNEFQKQSEAARDAAINAIMKNLESVRSAYNGQITTVGNDYDRQIDENELRKERARRVTRENQANRGQLESGLGRQELLNQNVGYDKITSNLKSARTKAINDIYNLITQAEAEAESGKANIRNNYANSLLQFRLANMQ